MTSWIKPINLGFANVHTLDLSLILDPATNRVVARYRNTSDDPAAIKTIGEIDARTYPWMAKFFKMGLAAGVLSSNTADTLYGIAFDSFEIVPSSAPQGAPPPAFVGQVYIPLVRR